jgi:DNA-binding response OmpR family regulator
VAHILIVEDSELVSAALRTLLEAVGHRVSVAGSIRDALATADADPPEVTLLDLVLPDGDGLSVARHIRAARHQTIVFALTGRDEPEVAASCLSAGCHAVLVKPVPTRELISRITASLQ